MASILYYIFIYPLSLLPFWVLYAKSNFLRFILYNIIGFRVGVIKNNLEKAFPNKTLEERKAIEREFYLHMCDLILESIKFFSISRQAAYKMMDVENSELLTELYNKGKDVILAGGHYGNWELYALTSPRDTPHDIYALYTPLTSEFFDRKMKSSRERYGLKMHSIKDVHGLFNQKSEKPRAFIFGADQSPSNPHKAYWLTFLNQETGVQFGTEKFAQQLNAAVVFGFIDKVKRGQYKMSYRLICENANDMPYGKITELHTKYLEEKIIEKPPYWLWSHKRWKRTRPEGVPLHG